MKFSVLVLLLILGSTSGGGCNKKLVFPALLSVDNYILIDTGLDFSGFEQAVSVCAWVKPYVSGRRWWFTLGTSTQANEFSIGTYPNCQYLFGEQMHGTDNIIRNKWTHICFTWSAASLTKDLYHNGVLVATTPTPPEREIGTPGKLVLGQEQDSFGGGFDTGQAFAGELYNLNVVKKKLSEEEIKGMYDAGFCSRTEVFYSLYAALQWEEVLRAERHGSVAVEDSGCSKWDILYDFVGQHLEITANLIEYFKKYHFD